MSLCLNGGRFQSSQKVLDGDWLTAYDETNISKDLIGCMKQRRHLRELIVESAHKKTGDMLQNQTKNT